MVQKKKKVFVIYLPQCMFCVGYTSFYRPRFRDDVTYLKPLWLLLFPPGTDKQLTGGEGDCCKWGEYEAESISDDWG